MVLNAKKKKKKKINLNLMKSSLKIMMKTVIKDILLKQMLSILKIYIICIATYHSYQTERMKIKKCNKLVHNLYDKSSETSMESWTDIKKEFIE